VLDLSNHACFSVQGTVDLDFLIANNQWYCHFEVQLKLSNFTFKHSLQYQFVLVWIL